MSDTNLLDDKEKLDILFKQYLGFPFTSESKRFFQENSINYNNYLIGDDILIDEIPTPKSVGAPQQLLEISMNSINGEIQETLNRLDISLNVLKTKNNSGIIDGSTNPLDLLITMNSEKTIMRFEKLELQKISDSPAWFCPINQSNNKSSVLQNALSFSYKTEGSFQYLYSLFDEQGNQLLPQNGNWIFDIKSGVITFYDPATTNIANINNINYKLYLSFYKYVGKKGVQNFSISDNSNNGSNGNLNNININSAGSLDISGNLDVSGISNFKNQVIFREDVKFNKSIKLYNSEETEFGELKLNAGKLSFKNPTDGTFKLIGSGTEGSGGGGTGINSPWTTSGTNINYSNKVGIGYSNGSSLEEKLNVNGNMLIEGNLKVKNIFDKQAEIRIDSFYPYKLQFKNEGDNEWKDFGTLNSSGGGGTGGVAGPGSGGTGSGGSSTLSDLLLTNTLGIPDSTDVNIYKPISESHGRLVSSTAQYALMQSSLILDNSSVKIENLSPADQSGQPVEYSQFKYVLDQLKLLPDYTNNLNVQTIKTRGNCLFDGSENRFNNISVTQKANIEEANINKLKVYGNETTFKNNIKVCGNADICGNINVEKGQITFKDGTLQFHHGDKNWRTFGTNIGGNNSGFVDSTLSTSLFSDSEEGITPQNISDDAFLFWKDAYRYLILLNPMLIRSISTIRDPKIFTDYETKIRSYIFNLPLQLSIPGPTEANYSITSTSSSNISYNLNWKYTTTNVTYSTSTFFLNIKNKTTKSEIYKTLKSSDYSLNNINNIYTHNIVLSKSNYTIKIYAITYLGKSIKYATLDIINT